ncbi:MAG: peptidoglycan DD-metalloendopeptidase family protein [Gammaproteobacteria bacterium]|nr:peptidoglycan DD-metalloendopeptidase family protein [Gammaproteobacteria bacterium]
MQNKIIFFSSFLRITLLFSLFLLPFSAKSSDTEDTDYTKRLAEVKAKIALVLTDLNKNKNKRDNIKDQLQKLERNIAKTSKSLREVRRKHKKSSASLKSLKAKLAALRNKLNIQRNLLSSQIKSAYTMGQQAQIKMFLNQQQPAEMGRAMVYFDYLNTARSSQINEFLHNIREKEKLEVQITTTNKELEKLAQRKLKQKKSLDHDRISRKRLLTRLNKDINNQQLTLSELENSRSRIETLLSSLGELLADIPTENPLETPFPSLKGKLPWPVKGKFSARFGESRNQGDLNWNGVVIKTAYGTPVRAISNGRVAFADWLQGFGFITIIDHDNEYMSLYGHSQELYKETGDWVEAGEIIATVGDSGGQNHSGLYFEIRHKGKPVNPNKWCTASL